MLDMTAEYAAAQKPAKRPRDLRLDLFRGLAMLIIFIAHVPDNAWDRWIPARFGFSSAAELFVFCSGLASSLAFGSVFVRRGWFMGAARIAYRMWQVYWAHIGLFFALAVISIMASKLPGARDYVTALEIGPLIQRPAGALPQVMTLTFLPDLLNILPMYLVLLALVPVVMALARLARWLPLALSFCLWLIVQVTHIDLPNHVEQGWVWFFNPFAWQMLFFTGFAFGMGFLPRPTWNVPVLFWSCVIFLLLAVPVNFWAFTENVPALQTLRDWIVPDAGVATSELSPLRYLHFLASAYVALSLADRYPRILHNRVVPWIAMVGQQSLATFMASLSLAWIMGMMLDVFGRNLLTDAIANITGLAAVFAIAYLVRWFKRKPWEGGRRHGHA
ncbi:OpgC family protein [Methylovirgula sp. 4M-Z18]|uniref:OpgC family protein n=1 Tax=Methylovirgula sp. 4M-Z18 TaxID=2293567 RepID=UPI000E2F768F|nr:OpgC domain-containing protein [Methylovirgula sp. 4M-Z18]RFB78812.1 OpgC domain-containing protein [Methylovirgula sp. 4M-Z18]